MNLVNCPQCGAQILAAAGLTQCPKCKAAVRVADSGSVEVDREPPVFSFAPGSDPPSAFTPPPGRPNLSSGGAFSDGAYRHGNDPAASGVEANPYQSPAFSFEADYGTHDEPLRSGLLWILFSFEGRIPRRVFWAAEIGVRMASYAAVLPVVAFLEGPQAEEVANWMSLILTIPMLWMSLAIAVKRWHDLDKSGWWVLINFVPCIGPLWALIETGFFRGTVGRNQYGSDPT